MAVLFQNPQAQTARYGLERVVYTGWPFAGTGGASSLATGTTLLANAQGWNQVDEPTWQADISMLQSTRDTAGNTTLTYVADPTDQVGFGQAPGNTYAARQGTRQMRSRIAAVQTLQLSLVNANSAATASWQTNFGVTMRRLTAADKLLAQRDGLTAEGEGWYDLTVAEADALHNLGLTDARGNVTTSGLDRLKALVAEGYAPISPERIVQGQYGGRVYEGAPDWFYPTVSSTVTQFAQYQAHLSGATKGRFPVLRGIGVPGGSNVAITLNVDGNTNYTAIQGSAFVQTDDEDWDLWIPAMRYINVSVATGTGGAGGATPIRLRTDWVSMSDILAVLFGRVKRRTDLADPMVFDMAIAGMAA